MTSKNLWKKTKDVVLYLVFIIIFVSLTSSFVVEDVYMAADRISMQSQGIADVYAINIGAKTNNNAESEEEPVEIKTEDGQTIIVTEYFLGDTSDEILEYQNILYSLGFMTTQPSTQLTEEVQTALKTYQAFKGLEITGNFDRSTIISLLAETPK